MANDSITFFCPACSIKLTVPDSLAGVIGPCPSCRNQIQAPYPPPVAQQTEAPAYQPPVAPSYPPLATPSPAPAAAPSYPPTAAPIYPTPVAAASPAHSSAVLEAPAVPTYQPAPAASSPSYQTSPSSESHQAPMPAAAAPPVPVTPAPIPVSANVIPAQETPASPAVLRPEPRQLPQRTTTTDPVGKPMPETHPSAESTKAALGRSARPRPRKRVIRLLVPLVCIILLAALVFGLLSLLLNQKKTPLPNPAPSPKQVKIIPDEPIPPISSNSTKEDPLPTLPVSKPELPNIAGPPPELPAGIEPFDAQAAAYEVLEKFLTAKSLSERLPLIETKTTEPELAKSCLAGSLPASSNIASEFRETNAVEQVIDFYYSVDFDAGSNRLAPYTILVRKRGSSDFKVVADPFLDSYGGRLASYAKKPSEKAGIFQVIIYAVASCTDENVPNREKKLTLKMLPKEDTKEITRAYFGRQSKIGLMLEDGTYSISFGKARACTVMLRWNTEDRSDTPYLEAIDLKSLDWNP